MYTPIETLMCCSDWITDSRGPFENLARVFFLMAVVMDTVEGGLRVLNFFSPPLNFCTNSAFSLSLLEAKTTISSIDI